MSDPYEILGVAPDATPVELKAAYRALAREWHPDRNSAPDAEVRFREIASAWEILGDPTRRAEHDQAQGRISQGVLPEDFVNAVAVALERAEIWIHERVLPHYAQYHRGAGLELAVRLAVDAPTLAVATPLAPAGWWARRKVRVATRKVVFTMHMAPSDRLTAVHATPKHHEIMLLPMGLYRAGVQDQLEEVVMQVLIEQVALALGAWRAPLHLGEEAVTWARALDDRAHADRRRAWQWRIAVGALLGVMFLAGYFGV